MGHTVDLMGADLRCRAKADAFNASRIFERDGAMCPHHFVVYPRSMSNPERDDSWIVEVDYFAGDHWDDESAQQLWLAIAPHMADGATIEFREEDGTRWRVRWSGGEAFEEYPKETIWALERKLTPKEDSP